MKKRLPIDISDEDMLVRRFNQREEIAFEDVYGLLYPDLLYFSRKLYRHSECVPEDMLQDLFLKLWIDRRLVFTSVEHIKAYTYTCIRNHFREYYSHRKVEDRYREMLKKDDDLFVSHIIETEIISELSRIPDIFPAECTKVLALYLEGWEVKDIAEKLEKSPSTIYAQRQEIILILKKILNRKSLLLLIFIRHLSRR